MSDQQSDLAFQEVDDDLRKERLNALWKRYGKYLIGTAVGIVLAVAGREGYTAYVMGQQEKNASLYENASETAALNAAGAAGVWAGAAEKLSYGYAALAQFREAAVLATSGDVEAAIAAYDKLAARSDIENTYRELAQLLAAMTILDKTGDYDSAKARLVVIAQEGRPWYFSSLEQLALAEFATGNYDVAYSHFSQLASLEGTPRAIAERAKEMQALAQRRTGLQKETGLQQEGDSQ